jgi:hypothetical protein
MKLRKVMFAVLLLALGLANLYPGSCLAQSESTTLAMATPVAPSDVAPPPTASTSAPAPNLTPISAGREGDFGLSRVGVGVKMSTLGPGAEMAYALTRHIDVRGGFNYLNYTDTFTNDGVNYGGTLKFESGEVHLDYFLWHSLHVSPGLLFSNGSPLNATLGVPAGETFTLSGTTYESNAANVVAGTGALKFNTVAPSILLGVGNLVPRGDHRFSVRFEIGGAFRGTPTTALNFTGSVCDTTGNNCPNIATDSTFQSSVASQQAKFNNDISFLKFYPIISLGFGFKL